jgi:flagellar P-ring protein precursor FlgI
VNVDVVIPPQYRTEAVLFVSQVLALTIDDLQTEARVVINQRAGSIVIGADVEIGSVVVTHKNIVIETGDNLPPDRFVALDPQKTQTTKLKALVEALDSIKVPTEDVIEIIKGLERNGKIHGRVIVE